MGFSKLIKKIDETYQEATCLLPRVRMVESL